jgi:hypothetical protein
LSSSPALPPVGPEATAAVTSRFQREEIEAAPEHAMLSYASIWGRT